MFNPNEIFEKKFEKAAFGYKPEAVDDFLTEVSEAYSKLLWEKKELDKTENNYYYYTRNSNYY